MPYPAASTPVAQASRTRIAGALMITIVGALWIAADARNLADDARRRAAEYAQPIPGVYEAGLSASHGSMPIDGPSASRSPGEYEPTRSVFTVFAEDRTFYHAAESM